MKRLISWLLALTLICGLLPMSVFAEEVDVETGTENPDLDVDFGELTEPTEPEIPEPVYVNLTTDRQMLTIAPGQYVYGIVDNTAGVTYTVNAYSADSESWSMGLFRLFVSAPAAGEVATLSLADFSYETTEMEELTITFSNAGEEDAYVWVFLTENAAQDTTGTMNDPADLILGENVADIAAGNTQGYFYTYTAEQTGTLVLEFSTNAAGWFYVVNNKTTSAYGDGQWSDSDPVINPAEIEVTEGDVLEINVNTYDPNSWDVPAGTVTINASYKVECDHSDAALKKGAVCPTCGLLKISGVTAGLGNSLALNFVFDTSKLSGTDNYAVVTKDYADGTQKTITINQSEWAKYSGNLYYVAYSGVSAKEMTDNLVVTVYNAQGEPVTIEYQESIRDYLMRMIATEEAKTSPRAKVLTLYVDMLNYGAAAQDYFDQYHIDDIANAGLTEAQQAYATQNLTGEDCRVKGEGYAGSTLSLKSEITLNFVFNNSVIDNAAYASVSYTDHYGNAQSFDVQSSDFGVFSSTRKYVAVSGMSVASCGCPITVVLYSADGTVLSTNVDSAISYVVRLSDGAEVYTMIWKFATSAYNYFHN